MNNEHSAMLLNQLSNNAAQEHDYAISILAEKAEYNLVSMLNPTISKDGNQWCVLYGTNLQDGVAGFGDTPYKAVLDFNKNYKFKTKQMKLTAAIAGAYLGCDAIYHDTEIEYFTPHRFKMLGVMTQMVFSMDNHYSMRFTKLILTPLSKISDEDAVEVVKIWYKGSEKISTISIDEGKRIALSMCVPSEITDYLRSKSYNIGYGKYTAQDLITEGVVIVNNKNKGI